VPDKENAKRFTGTKKCGGTKTHKGACADWVFVEPEPPEWAVSSYRLLGEVKTCFYFFYKNIIS